MLSNKRKVMWFAASVVLCGLLALSGVAGPPDGRGGGNGGGGGGGGSDPPTLPDGLGVRYRLQFIPLPAVADSPFSSYQVNDINDVHEVVGGYNDEDRIRVGFYYDADDPDKVLTANQMILVPGLPAEWVETSFTGINNHGEIVGMVRDILGFRQCILIYPNLDLDGNKDGTYSYKISSPVDAEGYYLDSHFTQINDSGDIVGISWDGDGVGTAFAYNPGIFPFAAPVEPRDFTFFGWPGTRWNSMQVKNARLGTVRVGDNLFWFDFLDGQESLAQLPASERSPTSDGISNDGQFTVNEALFEKKGKNGSYRYTPGIGIQVPGKNEIEYVWQGDFDAGYATLVNSADGENTVGDVIGFNENSNVRWLRHADYPDWGYLDLDAMVVFSPPDDEETWSLISGAKWVTHMSDRDPIGFGMLAGANLGFGPKAAYVLIPEKFPNP